MFAGFKSRWTMPFSCAYSRPVAICGDLPRVVEGHRSFGRLAVYQFHHQRPIFDAVNLRDVGVVERESRSRSSKIQVRGSSSILSKLRYSGIKIQRRRAVRRTLHNLDPGLPSFIQTRNQAMEMILFPARVATVALGVLGLMGAMLSVTGIFGMAAYSVSKRLRELDIRMALGARRQEVLGGRWAELSNCSLWVLLPDYFSGSSRLVCWPTSSIRPALAIHSCWPAPCSPCCCWA
jgi:hypothetical protein